MEKRRYISVPDNKKAMEAYDSGTENTEDLISWILTESEFNSLWNSGVFDLLNKRCALLIDDFESELIDAEKLITAWNVVNELKERSDNKELEHLYALILEAINRETVIAFDF
ncbi:MAG: hypothetical protein IKH71_13505 [Oscillospiraceae bacterium]|nr:hypothetical protein [Oscillospiraceae bacterium]MBR6835797.1 hypothetical protein [Oscillospiraceae bacterium]